MRRLPFLDDLRFFCTVLMVAYHAGISFMHFDSPLWPAHDLRGSGVFDYMVLLLRWSRMPIVFFVSGLSAGLLFQKGRLQYIQNRLHRIYLPMIAAAIFTLPLINTAYGRRLEDILRILPAHFWFLIYLVPMLFIPPLAPPRFKLWASRFARFSLAGPPSILLLSVLTYGLVFPMKDWLILDHAIFEILPKPYLLLYYTVFFVLGWALSHEAALLPKLKNHTGAYLVYILFAAGLLWYSVSYLPREDLVSKNKVFPLILLFSNNLLSWVSLFFWAGLFLRISPKVHRFFKPVRGSAYWVYLTHYPIVLFAQIFLADKEVNVYLKFAITFGGTLFVCVLTWWAYTRLKRATTAAPA